MRRNLAEAPELPALILEHWAQIHEHYANVMSTKSKHTGQLPLDKVEEAVEDKIINSDRPKGMPALSVLKTEVLRQGLTESDAEHAYDVWLMNGFSLRNGKKVRDWKAAIRVWKRNEYFPSQRRESRAVVTGYKTSWKPPSLEEVKAYAFSKRWSASFARHCYSVWLGNNWRHYGEPIRSDSQWQALMESMDYRP